MNPSHKKADKNFLSQEWNLKDFHSYVLWFISLLFDQIILNQLISVNSGF